MTSTKTLKKIRPFQLVAVIFFTVSGGPYGLEPLLSYAGEHAALLILLITPLMWDIPAILTVLELNSMMPITGGYYKWVKHALGTRWGFYEGWWTWLYTFIDLAIYPALFVTYLTFFFPWLADPQMHTYYRIGISLVFIWLSAGLNILGIVPVGRTSVVLGVLVITPFLILFGLAFYHHSVTTVPHQTLKGIPFSSLGMALYTVMWNCLGWDNVTTYAEEVEKPIKSYLYSMFTAFVLVIVLYFLIILVSQQSGVNTGALKEQAFPAVGVAIAGRWLGSLIALAGMASSVGIYAAVLLSVSRVPKVMADDDLLPARLNRLHPKFQSPYVSILVCSAVVSFMAIWPLIDLFIIDVTVYGAGLSLEYIALVKLRKTEPDTYRPFRVPFNRFGLCLMLVLPFTVYFVALGAAFSSEEQAVWAAVFAIAALATAELVWQIILWKKPHHRHDGLY
jgi:amino acid transporter